MIQIELESICMNYDFQCSAIIIKAVSLGAQLYGTTNPFYYKFTKISQLEFGIIAQWSHFHDQTNQSSFKGFHFKSLSHEIIEGVTKTCP